MNTTYFFPSGDFLVACSVTPDEQVIALWWAEIALSTIERYPTALTSRRVPMRVGTRGQALLTALHRAKQLYPPNPSAASLDNYPFVL